MVEISEIKFNTPVGVLIEEDKKEIIKLVENTNFKPVSKIYDFLEIEEVETGFNPDVLLNEYTSLFLNPDFYYEFMFDLIKQKQQKTEVELNKILDSFNFK